jgi:hypothetical protein
VLHLGIPPFALKEAAAEATLREQGAPQGEQRAKQHEQRAMSGERAKG